MALRPLLLIAAIGLAGCASDHSVFSGYDMALDSDTCRSAAMSRQDVPLAAGGMTAADRQAAYDRAYRDCMADKGYRLEASAP